MSDLPADYAERLNMREQIARIDRTLDEAAKFRSEQAKLDSEQSKLAADQTKFTAEQIKLAAEADKFRRDRFLAPLLAAGAVAGGVAAAVPIVLRAWGVH